MDDRQTILNHFAGNFQTFYKKYLPNLKAISGDEFQAVCPFHDDKDPSFNLNGNTGRYFCHGCGKKGDIFHFYAKVSSLDNRRDYPKILKGIAGDFGISLNGDKKSRIVKTYDYTDAGGQLLFQVCRMEPKDFRQRRPNGKGGWIWNLKGIDPVLYGLPDILKAPEVILCEGEKDADNLKSLGFTATTCPMGAKKWKDSYSDIIKGKDIILMPDNDLAGREHMAKVAASINGNAESLKWIDLPGVPDKGDVSDFIEGIADKTEAANRLAAMIENAKPYEPPKVATIEDAILTDTAFFSLDIQRKERFLDPWLTEQSLCLISGWRGTGKTWFALSILDAVTRGKPFGPWEPGKSAPCLFLDGEMPITDIQERLSELSTEKREHPLYIYSDAYANLLGLPRAHLANESWREKMKRILITRKVRLWVIDNLASLAGGLDENKKQDWDPVNSWLLDLRFAGISTIMLHHTNKDGGQRGTSAREDNLDTSIILKPPADYSPEDGCRFVVHFTKARVSARDLKAVSDTEFKLTTDDQGETIWTWANVKGEQSKEVIRMLSDGMKQIDISATLQISKGQVSKIRARGIKEGYITEKNALTQSGFSHVSGT